MPKTKHLSMFLIMLLFISTFSWAQAVKNVTSTPAASVGRPIPNDDIGPAHDIRPTPEPEPEPLDLIAVSEKLAAVEDLFAGGGSVPVTFDSLRAKDRGTDASIIELAEELAAYTNDLMRAADNYVNHRTSQNPFEVQATSETYPMVRRFFDAATAFHASDAAASVHSSAISGQPVRAEGWCNWLISDTACTCGHWLYPRPNGAAQWKTYNSSNPAATLQSWGYHQTPAFAGGGWTRPQTYNPSRCGYNTYRDQALINSGGKSFREQNYAGFTPRGEPNPEFWNGWPWPYPAWPAYVQWWHAHY